MLGCDIKPDAQTLELDDPGPGDREGLAVRSPGGECEAKRGGLLLLHQQLGQGGGVKEDHRSPRSSANTSPVASVRHAGPHASPCPESFRSSRWLMVFMDQL